MKKALYKNLYRSIKNNKTRFFSILLIIAIGVGFFAGINATEPDMILSSDHYYKEAKLFDVRVTSPLGFSDKDMRTVKNLNQIETVQAGYTKDLFLTTKDGNTYTVRLHSYEEKSSELNKLQLVHGRLPKKQGEIVVEAGNYAPRGLEVGSTVKLSVPEGEKLSDSIKTNSLKVVGQVNSPFYISYERGQTTIGDGSINFFAYMNENDFTKNNIFELYIKTKNSGDLIAYSEAYQNNLKPIKKELMNIGRDTLVREKEKLEQNLNEGKQELEKNKRMVDREFREAEQKLQDAEQKIEDGENELAEKENKYKTELTAAKNKLETAEQQIKNGKSEYHKRLNQWKQGYSEYEKGATTLDAAKENLDRALTEIEKGETELNSGKAQLDKGKQQISLLQKIMQNLTVMKESFQSSPPKTVEEYVRFINNIELSEEIKQTFRKIPYSNKTIPIIVGTIDEVIDNVTNQLTSAESKYNEGNQAYEDNVKKLDEAKQNYNKHQAQYIAGIKRLTMTKQTLDATKKQLAEANRELTINETKIREGKSQLKKQETNLKQAIAEGENQLQKARAELATGKEKYKKEKADAEKEIRKSEQKLKNAEEKLTAIPDHWFVNGREANPGYTDYHDDARRIGEVAKVFPLFFFLVAALVCMTTMTRMVEEERGQIGTLKALGYGTSTILSKYFIYAIASSLTGAIIGLLVGFKLFPTAIMNAYGIMYNIPNRITAFHMNYTILSLIIALTTTTVATLVVTMGELRSMPSVLMQPRAPKPGKRIFLERIAPIWSKLSFSQKVAFRNIFRYKQRFLMTVLGIAGCTALLLTGFGLRDSINDILDKQFKDIFLYDGQVVFDTEKLADVQDINEVVKKEKEISASLPIVNVTVDTRSQDTNRSFETNLVVPQKTQSIGDFVNLHERKTGLQVTIPNNAAVITEKLATLLHVQVGDIIEFRTNENKTYDVKVGAIVENYLAHYIYMSPDYYETVTKKVPAYNTALFNIKDRSSLNDQAFKEKLMEQNSVLGVGLIKSMADDFKDTMDSLDFVVLILIISAGVLAVVVLYNLTNINITERIREIATIKVLGFRNHEVDLYVYRENIFLTIIGTLVGLILGVILHKYVIKTMEIETMMFGQTAHAMSYVWSILLTLLFTLIVNFTMHFKLQKVNMVESLKSIE
ncbi:FtsX-like permease family protein [Bacillus andreraoultii]|uniref:FtsX-like permease family protein n=1 Tax=Bacillus andreraoultii TaxID=1499685 RepID=UPI00067EE927|nr:FtsX-like permease family protein [Bacillus andreraoultii]